MADTEEAMSSGKLRRCAKRVQDPNQRETAGIFDDGQYRITLCRQKRYSQSQEL